MKKLFIILLLFIFVACSNNKTKRISKKESDRVLSNITDDWVSKDTEIVVDCIMQKINSSPKFQKLLEKNYYYQPKVFIAENQNNTDEENFPIDDLNNAILQKISDETQFVIIDNKARQRIQDEIDYQNEQNKNIMNKIKKQTGANLLIFGNVNLSQYQNLQGTNVVRSVKDYSVGIRFTDVNTAEEIFRARCQIHKYSERKLAPNEVWDPVIGNVALGEFSVIPKNYKTLADCGIYDDEKYNSIYVKSCKDVSRKELIKAKAIIDKMPKLPEEVIFEIKADKIEEGAYKTRDSETMVFTNDKMFIKYLQIAQKKFPYSIPVIDLSKTFPNCNTRNCKVNNKVILYSDGVSKCIFSTKKNEIEYRTLAVYEKSYLMTEFKKDMVLQYGGTIDVRHGKPTMFLNCGYESNDTMHYDAGEQKSFHIN